MTVFRGLTVAIFVAAISVVPGAQPPAHAQAAPGGQNLAEANRLIAEAQKAPPAAAIPLYERALSLAAQSLGTGHANLAPVLDALGEARRQLGQHELALQNFQRSLDIRERALGAAHASVAISLGHLGRTRESMRQYPEALSLYQRSLALREQTLGPEHTGVAAALNSLAALYRLLGEYGQALPLYERGLAIFEKALGPEHISVATTVNNLAALHRGMNEFGKALPLYERSLAIFEKALGPDHPNVALILGNLTELLRAMGEYGKALRYAERSLAINERVHGASHSSVALSLNNLAAIFESLGEHDRALTHYQRSLAIYETSGGPDHPNVALSLNNLGSLYRSRGEYAKALPLFQRSLAIYEKVRGPIHLDVALSLNNLGALYRTMGEYAKAVPVYERSLAIREKLLGAEHLEVATSLNNLAAVYEGTGEHAKGASLALRALSIAGNAGSPELVWRAQAKLARMLALQKQQDAAIFFAKQAVNQIQALRARLVSIDREYQRSFLQDKEATYRHLADLLIDQGRLPEAQQVLTMLKEEEFFDFIRRDEKQDGRTTNVAFTAGEEPWRKHYEEVSARLGAVGTELAALDRKARQGLSDEEKAQREQLRKDRRVAQQAFDGMLGTLMRELATAGAARNREIGERGLTNLRTLQDTLATLGEGVVAVHYIVGESTLRILLTTSSIQIARSFAIGAVELNRKIAFFQRQLRDPRLKPMPLARDLYRTLFEPIAEDLRQAKAQTLMISLDGTLRYIPIAALHDGKKFVAEDYRMAIYTEASRDRLRDRPQTEWRAAGLGLTRKIEGFSELTAVKAELESIIKAGEKGVLPGEMHFDAAFNASRVRDALDKGYSVLHIASHFVFRPGTEADSFLLLGDGARLTLRDLRDDDYRFRDVDLITLSACETALGGGQDANGIEIEGFGALAQKQGARGVIATLWPVADESTGIFMQQFYRLREDKKLSKAEAMRQVQAAFIHGSASSAAGNYSHPYFWAPFILMGNWL